jgi:hypothetical protein
MTQRLKVEKDLAVIKSSNETRHVTPYSVIFCEQVLAAQDFGHTPTKFNSRKLQKANILLDGHKNNRRCRIQTKRHNRGPQDLAYAAGATVEERPFKDVMELDTFKGRVSGEQQLRASPLWSSSSQRSNRPSSTSTFARLVPRSLAWLGRFPRSEHAGKDLVHVL